MFSGSASAVLTLALRSILRALITHTYMWQQWVNALLGLWVIVVPFLGLDSASLMWTLVVTGIVIAGLSLWSVGATSSERPMTFQRGT